MAAASTHMRKPVLGAAVFRGRERGRRCIVAKKVHFILLLIDVTNTLFGIRKIPCLKDLTKNKCILNKFDIFH